MSRSSSILPDDHAQFTTKDYWDKFFTQRGQVAFGEFCVSLNYLNTFCCAHYLLLWSEWYGDFKEVFPALSASISKTNRILVIGCGNSNFSSNLYDKGFHNITNLDFSELVIDEMTKKNIHRPNMQWVMGDMTALEEYFSVQSFDVVIDKGALDALMSENSAELRSKAAKMFCEIGNVLTATGKYFLISLAEDFVLETVTQHFLKTDKEEGEYYWSTVISQITTVRPSPFIPLLFTFNKSESPNAGPVVLMFNAVGNKNLIKAPKPTSNHVDRSVISSSELGGFLKHFQEFNQLTYRLGKLDVGRFETVPLWSNDSSEVPRFTLYIVDADDRAPLSVAVFFIPFGRESDYQFTTRDGLIDIAFQAACKRLIVVACNRPHVFGEMKDLQDELSPVIVSFKLTDMDTTEKIPFMAVAQDKSWEEIEQGKSVVSGIYVVEERVDDDDDDDSSNGVYRRLIFLQNQQFVQTEVRLLHVKKSTGNKKKKSGNKGKSTGKPNTEQSTLVFDYKYLDEHHRGMLASLTLNPALVTSASQRNSTAVGNCLLIGLGGGSLTMALQKFLPSLRISSCDLDEVVHQVACRHFGFQPSTFTDVIIQDGVSLIQKLSDQSGTEPSALQDVIIIDVDSKDPSLGLSAPPREFVTFETLEHVHQILKPSGLLLVNVVARSKSMFADFVGRLKMIFNAQAPATVVFQSSSMERSRGRVLELKPSDENVNICLICQKADPTANTASAVKGLKPIEPIREQLAWEKTLDLWLKVRLQIAVWATVIDDCFCYLIFRIVQMVKTFWNWKGCWRSCGIYDTDSLLANSCRLKSCGVFVEN
jgi:SAM-dependent methyltransferase